MHTARMLNAAPMCKVGRHWLGANSYKAILPCIVNQLAVTLARVLMGYLIRGGTGVGCQSREKYKTNCTFCVVQYDQYVLY